MLVSGTDPAAGVGGARMAAVAAPVPEPSVEAPVSGTSMASPLGAAEPAAVTTAPQRVATGSAAISSSEQPPGGAAAAAPPMSRRARRRAKRKLREEAEAAAGAGGRGNKRGRGRGRKGTQQLRKSRRERNKALPIDQTSYYFKDGALVHGLARAAFARAAHACHRLGGVCGCRRVCDGAGLRRVHPYLFEIRSFAKRRWVGRTFLDTVASEFGSCTREYFVRAAQSCPREAHCTPCSARDPRCCGVCWACRTGGRHQGGVRVYQ